MLVPGQLRILRSNPEGPSHDILVWVWAVGDVHFLLSHNGSGSADEFRALDWWHAQGHLDWEDDMVESIGCILEVHDP